MIIQPLFDRVLLKQCKTSHSNTIITPTESDENKMEVLMTGTNENFTVSPGDIVLINKYTGSEFVINDEKFTLIKETDILGIIKENQ